jgi:predicted ATPase
MLQIVIENLGKISRASLDLRPLTIFIGPNNTNKSWAAYSIYGILENSALKVLAQEYLNPKSQFTNSPLRKELFEIVNSFEKNFYVEIDVIKLAKDYLRILLDDVTRLFSKELVFLFFNVKEKELFKQFKIAIYLEDSMFNNCINNLQQKEFIQKHVIGGIEEKKFLEITKKSGENLLIISGEMLEDIPLKMVKFFIIYHLLEVIKTSLFTMSFIFPAERKALILLEEKIMSDPLGELLSEKPEIMKDLYHVLSSILLKGKYTYQKPIKDFLTMMERIKKIASGKVPFETNEKFNREVILRLLKTIVEGDIDYEDLEDLGIRLKFKPIATEVSLPIHVTSSMVKTLVPFYGYFKYLASGNDFIIIDEPEMNLHPKAQVMLLELFSIFINLSFSYSLVGNYLLLTTHTPYLLEHLINLIHPAKVWQTKEELFKEFFLKEKNVFLTPENVAIYLFEPSGNIIDVFDRKNIEIDWSTFSDIAGKISEITFKLEEIQEDDY